MACFPILSFLIICNLDLIFFKKFYEGMNLPIVKRLKFWLPIQTPLIIQLKSIPINSVLPSTLKFYLIHLLQLFESLVNWLLCLILCLFFFLELGLKLSLSCHLSCGISCGRPRGIFLFSCGIFLFSWGIPCGIFLFSCGMSCGIVYLSLRMIEYPTTRKVK